MTDPFANMTREQYVERLIDDSYREAEEMEAGFDTWVAAHRDTWRALGHDENWIRQRVELAQMTRKLHQQIRMHGLNKKQARELLRVLYNPMYDMMRIRVSQEHNQN